MINQLYQIPSHEILSIEWNDDSLDYDYKLCQLGQGHSKFLVLNPEIEDTKLIHYAKEIPETNKCIVFHYEGQ